MKKQLLLFICLLTFGLTVFAQVNPHTTYPTNGVQDERLGTYALTNATIYTHYNRKIEQATLVMEKGKIKAVGKSITIPKNAVTIDVKGKYIYPSFIDLYSDYGMPEKKKSKRDWNKSPQFVSKKKGAYAWNEAIKPEMAAHTEFSPNNKKAEEYRKLGFGTVLSHYTDGIVRGSGVVALLHNDGAHKVVIKDQASAHYSFSKGTSQQDYPRSLMGSIALLRQTYYDAVWYKKAKYVEEYNITLDRFNQLQKLPQIFEANDKLNILRADKIGDEFKQQYIFKAGSNTYQLIEAVKQTGGSLIIPLTFPDAYDVEDPLEAVNVSMADMKHWELAPANPAKLMEAGIPFALTTADLKKRGDFTKKLKKAIKRGLTKEDALKALTHTPAKLIGITDQVGSLEKGKWANFILTSGELFEDKTILHENWVKGQKYTVKDWAAIDLRGEYELKIGETTYNLDINGKKALSPKAEILLNDSIKIKVKHQLAKQKITLSFDTKDDTITNNNLPKGYTRLSGWISEDAKIWSGKGQDNDGDWIEWSAKQTAPFDPNKKKDKAGNSKKAEKNKEKEDTKEKEIFGGLLYPFLPYGWTKQPKAANVLIKNATVWTNETDGILTKADVWIKNGKIQQVGKSLTASGATEIDGTGKHITSGIIDEHSHIAISRGVNEGTQSVSAEVRIGDVINSEDVNIYRQLAGGVTTAQLLHGSANPVGGQSAIIKFRWGSTPENMKFENAADFIKFALGENVKQSNWGDNNRTRFPQTRMGVEQVYVDAFTRAKEYEAKLKKGELVRKDLELDALLEIVNKKRFITCHSYVQSEITMLMRVAEQFGFTINTFTHILEGYKVADKMREHGVAGSTFSDWWAYKYEVIDAIPYNAAMMTEMGVLSSINSDDAEMGRRLNQEAAKTIKYGKMSEEEAWKLVTLNPAKILHLDNRVGSIKAGKDADVVLWSANPLSIYAHAEQTYVDGVKYFDVEQDKELREYIRRERNRLIQKMTKVKQKGGKTQKPIPKKRRIYHCEDLDDHDETDIYDKGGHDH